MGRNPEPRPGPPPTDDRFPPPNSMRFRDSPSVDLSGEIRDRQSNLWHRSSQSINEDPRGFDIESRFSQRPDIPYQRSLENGPSMRPRQSWWDSDSSSSRVQGGSRRTFQAPFDSDGSHIFFETDGRPLDVEFELWDGPNNTPTKMKVYSEDGRMRPFNAMVNNPMKNMRSNTLSVRNTGPMEFPLNAGVGSFAEPAREPGLAGNEGVYPAKNDIRGFHRSEIPTPSRRNIVQGGALKTFPLDYSVEAVRVTLTTDGLPMNAKVELWGTSTHNKQIAEIYNDNGQSRPFSAIIDTPGGSNTVAITNTGPIEYPIYAVVEPVARMIGWNGEDEKFGGSLAPW